MPGSDYINASYVSVSIKIPYGWPLWLWILAWKTYIKHYIQKALHKKLCFIVIIVKHPQHEVYWWVLVNNKCGRVLNILCIYMFFMLWLRVLSGLKCVSKPHVLDVLTVISNMSNPYGMLKCIYIIWFTRYLLKELLLSNNNAPQQAGWRFLPASPKDCPD